MTTPNPAAMHIFVIGMLGAMLQEALSPEDRVVSMSVTVVTTDRRLLVYSASPAAADGVHAQLITDPAALFAALHDSPALTEHVIDASPDFPEDL